jgi:hypothetical protein
MFLHLLPLNKVHPITSACFYMFILIPKWITSACISVNGLSAYGSLPIFRVLNSSCFWRQVGMVGNDKLLLLTKVKQLFIFSQTSSTYGARRARFWNASVKRQNQGTAFTLTENYFTKAL